MFIQKKHVQLLYRLIFLIFFLICFWLIVKLYPYYLYLLKFMGQISLPFLLALLIAYLLYPLLIWLDRYQIPKGLSVSLIFLSFFILATALLYKAYPAILLQLKELSEQLPELIHMYEDFILSLYDSTAFFPEGFHDQLDDIIFHIEERIEGVSAKVLQASLKIFDIFILVTLIPILVFYILKDYDLIRSAVKSSIPRQYRLKVAFVVRSLDQSLGKYIRAQILISGLLTLATYIPFYFFKLQYPLLLAIIIGLTNIIPYFGPVIGAFPALLIALNDSYQLLVIVLIILILLQLLEGNFLSPYIVGKSLDVHPMVIILVLLVGGKLAGIIGLILAVPLLAIMKAIWPLLPFKRVDY